VKTLVGMSAEQAAAVASDAKFKLVIAGPGAGKTKTLCAQVAAAVEAGTPPERIVVVTYTNAAAMELEGRLRVGHGVAGRLGFCGTLHSFCLFLVRQHPEAVGLPQALSVCDDSQREPLLAAVMDDMGVRCSKRKALEALEACRGADPRGTSKEELAVKEYHRTLRRAGLLDFSMILRAGLDYLRAGAPGWEFDWLLVDEYQDACDLDAEFYEAAPAKRKFIVGDSDQALFGFRGGNVRHIVSLAAKCAFQGDWQLHLLETNWRCPSRVCAAAQALIERNAGRVRKRTVAANEGGAVQAVRCGTPAEELSLVLERIQRLVASGASAEALVKGDGDEGCAVLARTNKLAVAFADHLSANGVPVRRSAPMVVPADWQRTKLLLTVLGDPYNDLAALALVRAKDGPEAAAKVRTEAAAAMKSVSEHLGFPWGKGEGLAADVDLQRHGVSPESRERVHDACRELGRRGEAWTTGDLLVYLNEVEGAAREEGEGVACITIHSAKGREFRHVWVVGCEEGVLPIKWKDADPEEERRLAFVAITRARETLTMTWCAARPGSRGPNLPPGPMEPREPSRFLKEAGLL